MAEMTTKTEQRGWSKYPNEGRRVEALKGIWIRRNWTRRKVDRAEYKRLEKDASAWMKNERADTAKELEGMGYCKEGAKARAKDIQDEESYWLNEQCKEEFGLSFA